MIINAYVKAGLQQVRGNPVTSLVGVTFCTEFLKISAM